MYSGEELRIGVISDAGCLVGRDIGGIQRPKGQYEREPAGIGLAALRGVAYQTIRSFREIRPLLDQRCLREGSGDAAWIRRVVIRKSNFATAGERHRPGSH